MSDPLQALKAVTGQELATGATNLPNIPAVPASADASVTNWMASVKSWLETASGSGMTGFASKAELATVGIYQSNGSGGYIPRAATAYSAAVPPVPTGLVVVGAMTHMLLSFDDPSVAYGNHGYAEVWAAQKDNFSVAALVGTASGALFAHSVGPGSTRYYWIRFVSSSGIKGPFNGVPGTLGQTSQDPAWLLQVLTDNLSESQLISSLRSRIDLIDGPGSLPGSVNSRLATLQSQVNGLQNIPAYSAVITYLTGEQVSYSGGLYQAKSTTTGNLPSDTTYWLYLGDYSSLGDTVAAHTTQIATLTAADAGEVTARETLATQMRGGYTGTDLGSVSTGLIASEKAARVSGDNSLASSISTLAATVTSNNTTTTAAITSEQTARVNGDAALVSAVTTLQSRVSSRPNLLPNADFSNGMVGWSQSGLTLVANDTVWGRAATQGGSFTGTGVCWSGYIPVVAGEYYVVTGDSLLFASAGGVYFDLIFYNDALTALLDSAEGLLTHHDFKADDTNRAAHAIEVQAPSGATKCIVRFVAGSVVSATAIGCRNIKLERGRLPYTPFSNEAVTIQTKAEISSLSAQYTIKVDVNGRVTGYGLASTVVDGVPVSEFAIVADRFSIAPVATDANAADGSPFFYLTAPSVINGVTVPAGAYMKSAYITDLHASKISAGDIAADRMTAAVVSAINGSFGVIDADRINVTSLLQSTNFVSGASGWRILRSGDVEFNNGYFGGVVSAASVQAALGSASYWSYATPGTYSLTIPAGLNATTLRIRLVGASGSGGGGGGGAYHYTILTTHIGAGGNGGNGGTSATVTGDFAYNPAVGLTLSITVGTGYPGGSGGAGRYQQGYVTADAGAGGSNGQASTVVGYISSAGGIAGSGGGGGTTSVGGGGDTPGATGANGGNGAGGANGIGGLQSGNSNVQGTAGAAGTGGRVEISVFKGDVLVKNTSYQNLLAHLLAKGLGPIPGDAY